MLRWSSILVLLLAVAVRPAQAQSSSKDAGEGDKGTYLGVLFSTVPQALYAQARYDEADRFARVSEDASSGRARKAYWGPVRAKLLARRGDAKAAEALAGESVAIWAERDNLLWHGYALLDLAEVLRLAGRAEEAGSVVKQAVELFERKGIVPAVEAAQSLLAELEAVS